jgi:hypothetical protein
MTERQEKRQWIAEVPAVVSRACGGGFRHRTGAEGGLRGRWSQNDGGAPALWALAAMSSDHGR